MTGAAVDSWLAGLNGGDVKAFYQQLGVHLPGEGAEASVSCFANPDAHAHDDRNKSCAVNLGTGLWCCHGCGLKGNAFQAAVALGLSERRAVELARRYRLFIEKVAPEVRAKVPGERQLKRWREAFWANEKIPARLQELRGWTPYAMRRLALGWDGERVIFPVRNERLKPCGVVRYLPGAEGGKKSLAVGKRNLFPAPEEIEKRFPLFVVEGEPDAVSMWSLGLRAVAVPGAHSWRHEWAARIGGRQLVVLCDCDRDGRRLANTLRVLSWGPEAVQARVVDLEPGRDDGLDVGDWVREAAVEGGLAQLARVFESLVAG